jgi:predicted SAM-dependent methyltransferase
VPEHGTPQRLHLGCGDRYIPGFLHVDIRPLPHVDIVSGLDALPMFGDATADLVYASHVLEHFGRHQTHAILTEWHRVLKPGGVLRLAVPDFAQLVRVYQDRGDLSEILGPLVGRQDHPHNYHYNVFDRPSLTAQLEAAGYRDVREWDWRRTDHAHVDDFSQAYLPHMQKETGLLISLNLEASA